MSEGEIVEEDMPEALRRIAKAKAKGAIKLDLGGLGLRSVPEELYELSKLEVLYLGYAEEGQGNLFTTINFNWIKKRNRIAVLPDDLCAALCQLKTLDLVGNDLCELPDTIASLTELKILNLNNNQLSNLPNAIGELTKLQSLDLDNNQLSSLPDAIANLTKLQVLDLGNNQLSNLPDAIAKLTKLRTLNLTNNQLSNLPDAIANLTELQDLNLTNNQLSNLPDAIANLTELKFLYLDNNQLSSLPEAIAKLTELMLLGLRNNQLSILPDAIAKLTELQTLGLHGNQLSEEVMAAHAEGIGELRAYLRRLASDGVDHYEAKLLITGQGRIGKTCLADALDGKPRTEQPGGEEKQTTYGVDLHHLCLTHPEKTDVEMSINVWDFGGQKEYQITHQFFFTGAALYLVLWKLTDDPARGLLEADVEDWLRRIYTVAGPTAKVILVGSHLRAFKHRKDYETKADLTKFAPELRALIVDQVVVDSMGPEPLNIDELRNVIRLHIASLKHVGDRVSASYLQARDAAFALKKPYISFDEFCEICHKEKLDLTPREVFQVASIFIGRLGKGIYYGERKKTDEKSVDLTFEDIRLGNRIVLDAEWISKAIYLVINSLCPPEAADGSWNCLLSHSEENLDKIWMRHEKENIPKYQIGEWDFLVRLMDMMHVSYPSENRKSSIIGQLLPLKQPDEIPWSTQNEQMRPCQMTYELGGNPPGLVAFTASYSGNYHVPIAQTELPFAWQEGVFLRNPRGDEALFRLSTSPKIALSLEVRGAMKVSFFIELTGMMDRLFRDNFQHLEVKRLLGCPGDVENGTACNGEHPVKRLEAIIKKKGASAKEFCEECEDEFLVKDLLLGLGRVQVSEAAHISEIKGMLRDIQGTTSEMNFRLKVPCPRLFILRRIEQKGKVKKAIEKVKHQYEITFICEYTGQPGSPLTFTADAAWLAKIKPYVGLFTSVLGGLGLSFGASDDFQEVFGATTSIVEDASKTIGSGPGDAGGLSKDKMQYAASAGDYKRLVALLKSRNIIPEESGLEPIQFTSDKRWLWVLASEAKKLKKTELEIPALKKGKMPPLIEG